MFCYLPQLWLTVLMENFFDLLHEIHGQVLRLKTNTGKLLKGNFLWGNSFGYGNMRRLECLVLGFVLFGHFLVWKLRLLTIVRLSLLILRMFLLFLFTFLHSVLNFFLEDLDSRSTSMLKTCHLQNLIVTELGLCLIWNLNFSWCYTCLYPPRSILN